MSFKRSTIRLKFADEFDGLEVSMRRPTIADCLLHDKLKQAETEETMREMAALLSKRMISWNYVNDDDAPVEPTLESILDLDPEMFTAILTEWFNTAIKVAPPLPNSSPDGEQFPEESIPMETLSPSLVS